MKVLNFGSLNIDYVYKVHHIVRKGETILSKSLEIYPGGKGLNQSVALGRAGALVYHAGLIGEDGRFLIDVLNEAAVNTNFVSVSKDGKTGHAIIQNEKGGDNCIVLYGGTNQSVTQKQIVETLKAFGAGDILLLQNEISELSFLIKAAHAHGMKIYLNPSPVDDTLKKCPLELIDCFILNKIEAQQLSDLNEDDESVILARLIKKYPKARFVMTLGECGSIYSDGRETIRQGIYRTEIVDTTAAGDTFTGYFIAGEITGFPVKKSLDIAAQASSIAVSLSGASVSIPKREEIISYSPIAFFENMI